MPRRPKRPPPEGPDVVVDFVVEDGLLYVALENVSDRAARDLSVRFHRKFRGLGGRVSIPDLALFHRLKLLGPRKSIRTLVDSWEAYAARGEPERLTAWVRFHDLDGEAFRRRVEHDLGVYRDLTYVVRRPPGSPDPTDPDSGEPTPWRP